MDKGTPLPLSNKCREQSLPGTRFVEGRQSLEDPVEGGRVFLNTRHLFRRTHSYVRFVFLCA